MEISLSRASSLERAAAAAAAKIELEPTLKLSVHTVNDGTDFGALLSTTAINLMARIQDILNLQEAVYEIRALKGVANVKKVNGLLTEKHKLDALEKVITGVLESMATKPRRNRYDGLGEETSIRIGHDPEAAAIVVASIKTRAVSNAPLPNIEISALSEPCVGEYEKRLAVIRRRRQDLNDELVLANLEKIKLPESVISVLTKHGIIG